MTEVPIIRDVSILPPGGGKSPLTETFCADVQFQFPELATGATLLWDIDGQPGTDVEVDHDDCFQVTYDNCESGVIDIRVTPKDRFGRLGITIERSIQVTCNLVPTVGCTALKANFTPANGVPGDEFIFFITGRDLDNFDPALEDSDGVAYFEIDYEGDRIFDATLPANVQELPHRRVYDVAGAFRPIVRAYDADGDYGTAACDLVTVFAQTFPGWPLWLAGSTNAILPLQAPLHAHPETTIVLGTSQMGISVLVQGHPNDHLVVNKNVQDLVGEMAFGSFHNPLDLARAGNTVFVADRNLGLLAYRMGTAAQTNPALLQKQAACTLDDALTSERLDLAVFETTQRRLVFGSVSGASSADRLAVATFGVEMEASQTCDEFVQQTNGMGQLAKSAFGFGADFGISDFALAVSTAFAAVDTGDTFGIVAYNLSATDHPPYCASSNSGCYLHATAPVLALAASDDRLVFADAQNVLTVLAVTHMDGSAPAYALAATAQLPVAADRLYLLGDHIVVLNRTAAYNSGGSDYAGRQGRGIYLAPLTSPARQVFVLPSRRQQRDNAGYGGPQDVGLDAQGDLWVADGPLGLYRVSTGGAMGDIYAMVSTLALTAVTGFVAPTDDVGYGGTMRSLRIPDRQRRAVAALGGGGVAVIDFLTSGAGCPARGSVTLCPQLRAVRLSGDAIFGADVVHDVAAARDYIAAVTAGGGFLFSDAQKGVDLATYMAPTSTVVDHVDLEFDPDPSRYAIFYTFEARPGSKTSAYLQGLASDGRFVASQKFRAPEEFIGPAQDKTLGDLGRPPIFSRLAAKMGATRSLEYWASSGARICLEPYWGENCPVDPSDGKLFELFPPNFAGHPHRTLVSGIPFILRAFHSSGVLAVFDIDGAVINQTYSVCFDLPEAEQFDCSVANNIVHTASADPFWLYSTDWSLIVVDMRNPALPRVSTRKIASQARLSEVAGWTEGLDLAVAYHCDLKTGGSNFECNNQRLVTLYVKGTGGP